MRNVKNISTTYVLASIFLCGVFIITIFLNSGNIVNAQNDSTFITDPGAIRDNDINVDIIPEVPGPNQNVKINLSSYSTNINKAIITWSLNGKETVSGTGKTYFSFTTGEVGSKTEIGISLIVEEGTRVDKIITIFPSQVDLLWESPNSYVSSFYKGKALSIKESMVRVVAFPVEKDGSISPTTKVYNWKKNFVVDQANSGYGKYSFIVKNSYMDQSDTVSLNVSGSDGSGGTAMLPINYTDAKILVYEKSPVYGLRLNKLLNTGFPLQSGEMTVSAEAYYFSKNKKGVTGENMQYKWNINSTIVTPTGKPNELTLRGSNTPGVANITVGITNMNTLFQEAKQALSVALGK